MKQHLNKAAKGDSKAAAMVLNHIKENKLDVGDNLSELVHEFRAVYDRNVGADQDRSELVMVKTKTEERV